MIRFGDPRLPDRFWDKVAPEPNSGCWLWLACACGKGYGQFSVGQRDLRAHRVAYEALVGAVPNGLELDHLCRVTCCCNPMHLEPVTRSENNRRGRSPEIARRRQLAKTHCPQGHAYSGQNLQIRSDGSRSCRTCRQAQYKKYRRLRRQRQLPKLRSQDHG